MSSTKVPTLDEIEDTFMDLLDATSPSNTATVETILTGLVGVHAARDLHSLSKMDSVVISTE